MSTTDKISPDDINAKMQELAEGVENAASGAKDNATKLGIVALVVLLILAFVLGRKRGSANKTFVEIRRV